MIKSSFLYLLLTALAVLPASLQASTLPEIYDWCAGLNCNILYSGDAADSFVVARQDSANDWSVRYDLVAPSGIQSLDGTRQDYQGFMVLNVQQSYDLTNSAHDISMDTSNLSPDLGSLGPSLDMSLTTDALLAGQGNYQQSCCDFNDPVSNLQLMEYVPCLAEGCSATAQLNLLFLEYVDLGGIAYLNFNIEDTRALLMNFDDEYAVGIESGGFLNDRDFYVQPVPVPAPLILLVSGLMIFGVFRRAA